jgi:hypothetical protein
MWKKWDFVIGGFLISMDDEDKLRFTPLDSSDSLFYSVIESSDSDSQHMNSKDHTLPKQEHVSDLE